MKFRYLLALSVFLFMSVISYSQVVINEYMVSNSNASSGGDPSLQCDMPESKYYCAGWEYAQNEDMIELYNSGASAVTLTGMYLSDKITNPTKWRIPDDVGGGPLTIPAGGYQIFYCSKADTAVNSSGNDYHHTNFGLTQCKDEYVILADAAGTIIDQIQMDVNTSDMHTRGRTTDGASTWSIFSTHTLGAANTGAFDGYATTPTMSLAPGFYVGTQTVTITGDPGDQIRYTIDGSEPTAASALYSAPLSLSTTTVVKAKAFSTNPMILESKTEGNTYFIDVTHTIPVISVSGDDVVTLLNGSQLNPYGHLEYFESNGSFMSEASGDFNKHGNDSWAYSQRGIDFIARDEHGINNDIDHQIFPIKGRNGYQRLILKAGASDNYPFENGGAHIRDAFVHTMSQLADLRLDERTHQSVVVYANGQYWGVYEVREKVDDNDFTDYYYNQNEWEIDFLQTWGSTWEAYGCRESWDTLRAWILARDMSIPANYQLAKGSLNMGSLIDYFFINSWTVCKDWLNWNTAQWHGKNPAGTKKKWRYTLWDMDAVFGHYINYTGIPDDTPQADPCNAEQLPDPGSQGHTEIITHLLDPVQGSPEFQQEYISRYADLQNTSFDCVRAIEVLDSLVAIIEPEMPGHIARWGGSMATWQANVQNIRDFINQRCQGISDGLIDCYNLTGPYTITIDVDPPGSGIVHVNSITCDNYPWTGTYYGGIELLLNADPMPGNNFDYWEMLHTPQPSVLITTTPDVTDEEVSLNLSSNDDIIAHFCPETAACFDGAYVPTGFSPNNDGNNEILNVLVGKDVYEMRFDVYNRWGEKMFHTESMSYGWDGTFRGEQCAMGVYTYTLYVKFMDGEIQNTAGNITLLR